MLQSNNEYVLSQQSLRSDTSVGTTIREAQNAQSKKDFIHKLSISQKECDESLYWLDLLFHSILKLPERIIVSSKGALRS